MEDQEAEQEEESAEECYYVQPSDQQILACLPAEDSRRTASCC